MSDYQGQLFQPWSKGELVNLDATPKIPRQYQNLAVRAIVEARDHNIRRQLLVIPTAGGKTFIFSMLPAALEVGRTLVMAHRIELLRQAQKHLIESNPGLKVQIEQADNVVDYDCDIVVASKDSIGKGKNWQRRLDGLGKFDLVIVDEGHHITANTYMEPLRHLKAGMPGGPLLLGVTATPFRGDGNPLANVFDELVFSRDIVELTEEGERMPDGPYLSRLTGLTVRTGVDIGGVKSSKSDFNEDELARAVNIDYRNSLLISAIEDYAANRRAILVFAVDVAHGQALTRQFNDRGIKAAFVFAKTPEQERLATLTAFQDGELRVLVNVGIATEGWDSPILDCILMARPTKSTLLYTQMIGRGCRVFPGKENCLIIDVADNCGSHSVMSAGIAFGTRTIDFLGSDIIAGVKKVKQAIALGLPVTDGDTIDDVCRRKDTMDRLAFGTTYVQSEAEFVDVFNGLGIVPEVERGSQFPWVRVSNEKYIMPMWDKSALVLARDPMGVWQVAHNDERGAIVSVVPSDSAKPVPPFKWADKQLRQTYPLTWKKARTDAAWRSRDAMTSAQVLLLEKLGISRYAIPRGYDKGSASHAINTLIAYKKELKKNDQN